ncbi:MAG: DUF58 domain-containing protein [Lachnospiraceae bacterium]|nr:DUF58 domain-containing protein [Lachnospiraceae bacterium]
MKDKMLFWRRFIYLGCFVLSLVFISFYGGNLPYMLFFMMAVNGAISLLYILYVYATVKIYQEIPERKVMKQEKVSYRLLLNNESLVAYRDMKLNFMEGLSEIGIEEKGSIGLGAGHGKEFFGDLFCRYSGTYYVGIESIEIMDYFKIWRIRFPMPQKLKVTVKPRLLEPENLLFLKREESGNAGHRGSSEYELDSEVRKYCQGDNKKQIHWKNSVKKAQLMVRNRDAEEKTEFIVIMDGSMGKVSFAEKIISCDKLREVVLSLVNYLYREGYIAKVLMDGEYEQEICASGDFRVFYNQVVGYQFGKSVFSKRNLRGILEMGVHNTPIVMLTSAHSLLAEDCFAVLAEQLNVSVINVDLYERVEDILQIKE